MIVSKSPLREIEDNEEQIASFPKAPAPNSAGRTDDRGPVMEGLGSAGAVCAVQTEAHPSERAMPAEPMKMDDCITGDARELKPKMKILEVSCPQQTGQDGIESNGGC
jgi:hypothetical protein